MARNTKIKLITVLISISLILTLVQCANRLPPSGGEPDTTPPEIVNIYPENGTTNYNDNVISIEFSEYVNKNTIRDAVFISPEIEEALEYNWSGTTLDIVLGDSLKPDRTYTVTIGTEVKDINNNNPMRNSYTLTFSTGDEIDKGEISGKVYDEKPGNVLLYAYSIIDTVPNPSKSKPDYISQAGVDGDFTFRGLADSKYFILAVDDRFKDRIYNIGEDRFGVPNKIIELNDSVKAATGLKFRMLKDDTTAPLISTVTMTDKYRIQFEFNEYIDSSLINAGNFSIVDSAENRTVNPVYFYSIYGKPRTYVLNIDDTLKEESEVYLVYKNISDTYGNSTKENSILFYTSSADDSTAPKIIKTETDFENNVIGLEQPQIDFYFSEGINISKIENGITVEGEQGVRIPISVVKNDDASIYLRLIAQLKPRTSVKISLKKEYLEDIAGNLPDTLLVKEFGVINNLDFTGVSGNIISEQGKNTVLVLENTLKNNRKIYKSNADGGKFAFDKIMPGKYLLWAFYDSDSNSNYSFGKINPLILSEDFFFYSDTLNLRARWPVGDVNFNLSN